MIQHLLLHFVTHCEYMKIYQTCWWVFNGIMFNDRYKNGANISDQIKIIFNMKYTIMCYFNCLIGLSNIEVDLFDINFDENYTIINQIEGKFKRDISIFDSYYACDQFFSKFEQVYECAKTKFYNTQLEENQNDKKNILLVDQMKEFKDRLISLMNRIMKTNVTCNHNSNLFQEIESSETAVKCDENIDVDCNTKICADKTDPQQHSVSQRQIETQLASTAHTTTYLKTKSNRASSTLLKDLFNRVRAIKNNNHHIGDIDVVNCNQLFQDVFNQLSTYLRYCQMIGVSLHAIITLNIETVSTIFSEYAIYLNNAKSCKAGKYFKYCVKLNPLNERLYFWYSLYLFQIEKNYKQSFYNLKVSKKLGHNLDEIFKQFKRLCIRFGWKKNSIGFICDYNQCNSNNIKRKRKKLICSNCKCAWYCSKKCQKKDWIVKHKNECTGKYLLSLSSKEERIIKQQIWLIEHI